MIDLPYEEQHRQALAKRAEYEPLFKGRLATAYAEILAVIEQKNLGQMTQHELDTHINAIVAEAFP